MADNRPAFQFRAKGGVQTAAWKRRGKSSDYFTIGVSKSYKPKGATEWQNTTSFFVDDIPALIQVLQKTYDTLGIEVSGKGHAAQASVKEGEADTEADKDGKEVDPFNEKKDGEGIF